MLTSLLFPLLFLVVVGGIVGAVVWGVMSKRERSGSEDLRDLHASTPRDAFLHLLAFFSLYISVIGMIVGAWATADRLFPLPFERPRDSMGGGIRLAISLMVVAFPLFFYLSWLIKKKISAGEMRSDSKLPVVLAYLTIFVVAITTLIDLIAIVYQFLGGDLTSRVAMKAGSIVVVMGLVYWYYMADLRGQA